MASRAEPIASLPAAVAGDKDYLRYSEELLNVSSSRVTINALISTAILYAFLYGLKLAGLGKVAGIGWGLTLFLERSMIQYITTLAFFAGIWFLILKLPQIEKQNKGFGLLDFPELDKFPFGTDTAAVVAQKITAFSPEHRGLIVVRRFSTALQRLIHTNDTSEVHAVLNTMSDIDHEIGDASYRSARFAVWFIPVSGFLGTVLGISQAIAGFADIMNSKSAISLDSVKPILATSTFNLGVAFDTTLLALVWSSLLMLAMFYVQRREEVFLSAADEFCVSEIVNKIYVPDPGTTRILDGLAELTGNMVGSIDSLAKAIRADFAKLAQSLEKRDEERIPKLLETIQTRFLAFMDERDKGEEVFQAQVAQLLDQLDNIVDRGKAVEGFVTGLGQLTNLENILRSNLDAIEGMQNAVAQQQKETRAALTEQQRLTRDVLVEQQEQTRDALNQNKDAFDQLLPPLQELSTGIKIKVGE